MKTRAKMLLMYSAIFVSAVCVVGGVSAISLDADTRAQLTKDDFVELSYKSISPRGSGGGIILSASCESDYYHPTGGIWPRVDGYGTNNGSANRLEPGWVKKLNNGWCVHNNTGSAVHINTDHNNFINKAPYTRKFTWGD